jgi:hypothetical protein
MGHRPLRSKNGILGASGRLPASICASDAKGLGARASAKAFHNFLELACDAGELDESPRAALVAARGAGV